VNANLSTKANESERPRSGGAGLDITEIEIYTSS
jgi:hypothetical protein